MNILQILPSLDVGGVETGTVDLARYLVRHGHKAVVVSGGGALVRELDAVNVRHYTLPVGTKSPITVFRMIEALKQIIKNEGIDIVHARSRVPAIIACLASKATDRAFITTAHGYYSTHLLSRAMSWGKYVVVASNIMAKHMAQSFGVPYDRIRLIPRGVDLSAFRFRGSRPKAPGRFVVGMVSRITPLKGHADFIKAVALLNRRIPGLRAVIVGKAPKEKYMEDLELLVRRLGLSSTVEFLGSRKDVPELMAGMDVLVSATVTPEAFGRSIIEAQATGLAVVATCVGGVVDIIEDGRTGLLVDPNDPKDIADKVMRLYGDDALRSDLADAARRKVESDYNLDKMMERTISLYEEALRKANILVIKMSAIGDVVLSIPSLRAIRERYPHADIRVLVGLEAREVLDPCPYINGTIVCDFKDKHRGLRGLWCLAKEIQRHCFDAVIDLQNNKKSHILAALSFAPRRCGYDNGKFSFLLNNRIKDDAPYLDPVEHQFRVLRLAGVKPADKRLEIFPSKDDYEEAGRFLYDNWVKPSQDLVGINVRASGRWVSKNWPAQMIAELCDRLASERNTRVVLTGSPADAKYAEEIARSIRSKPLVAAGRTSINALAGLIKRFRVYVTPDSAPMHIAAAVGVPVVALFGPTDPARHLVPSGRCVVLRHNEDVKCRPCYSPACRRRSSCMRRITVDEMMSNIVKFLGRGAPP
jgi:lipopolysaccharide heptosyltransferase II